MSYKVSYSTHVGDPPPYKYFYVGDPLPVDSNKITYRELYPGDYYPYTTDRIKLNSIPDQYKIGYRDGYQNGYATALRDIIKKSELAEIPKPIEIWYNTENRSDKSDVIIDNALCPTCGAEANAACKGCED